MNSCTSERRIRMKNKNRVLIIGAGASGLFAAITAAGYGAEVTVLEKEKNAGRKLLRTGNGRCNLTNVGDPSFAYHGTDRTFAEKILHAFSPTDAIASFTKMGIYTTNRDGWIYPHSDTAESVLTVLLWRAKELHVKIKYCEQVRRIEKNEDCFKVFTDTWHYETDKIILACGTAASLTEKQLPANGYDLAVQMGHSVIRPLPALVPLKVKDASRFKWAGVRVAAGVSLYADDLFIGTSHGQVQLTDSGISGIPVFALSGQALRLLEGRLNVHAVLDFFPEMSEEAFAGFLKKRKNDHPDRKISDLLVGILPERLLHAVSMELQGSTDPEMLSHVVKNFNVRITGSQGFPCAQCTSGGVSTAEVSADTCESLVTKGFYLTGEVLDIDGECGGWNLQFAWSTGYLAGKHAAEVL